MVFNMFKKSQKKNILRSVGLHYMKHIMSTKLKNDNIDLTTRYDWAA